MFVAFLIFVIIALLIAFGIAMWLLHHANVTQAALEQGNFELEDSYQQMILDYMDDISVLESARDALEEETGLWADHVLEMDAITGVHVELRRADISVMSKLRSVIADLERKHAFHKDHCLPVLSELRHEAGI